MAGFVVEPDPLHLGLSLGSLLGVSVGVTAANWRVFDQTHAFLARVLRPIPPLAWVVFAIAWFGVSHAGAAFVIAIGVFWVNYFASYSACKNNDPKYIEMAHSFGRGGFFDRLFSVVLPQASPGFLGAPNRCRAGLDDAHCRGIVGCAGMGQEMNAARRRCL